MYRENLEWKADPFRWCDYNVYGMVRLNRTKNGIGCNSTTDTYVQTNKGKKQSLSFDVCICIVCAVRMTLYISVHYRFWCVSSFIALLFFSNHYSECRTLLCLNQTHTYTVIYMHKHTAPKRDQNHQIAVQCKFLCIVGCVRLNVTLDCMCVLVLSFPFSNHRYIHIWIEIKFFLFRNRRNNQLINLYLYKQLSFSTTFLRNQKNLNLKFSENLTKQKGRTNGCQSTD